MTLEKIDELSVILVSMYSLSVDDISSKNYGVNMFTGTTFLTLTTCQGVTIILPDVVQTKHFIYYDTITAEGKYKMIKDLMDKGYTEYDISKFLDTTGKNIKKIIKKGGK